MKYLLPSLLIASLTLYGCSTGDNLAGIEGTGDTATASGTVTGFGSIYVNGIHFNTEDTTVEINGEIASESELQVGMVVTIEGSIDTNTDKGVALHISADRILEGQIQSIQSLDLARKSLNIVGQTVYITEDTVFKDLDFDSITAGAKIAISGFTTTDGAVAATYVAKQEYPDQNDRAEIEGKITALDLDNLNFSLNEFDVDYSQATFEDGNIEDLAIGKRIEVKGTADYQLNTITAASIQFKTFKKRLNGYRTAIEGVATNIKPGRSFYIDETKIKIDDLSTAIGISEGSRVVATGMIKEDALEAHSVYIKTQSSNRFSGPLESVDQVDKKIRIFGSTFTVNEFTAYEDNSPSPNRYINLDDLSIGEPLEVFATRVEEQWIATRIRRTHSAFDQQSILRGQITSIVSDSEFYVFGIFVDASAADSNTLAKIELGESVIIKGQYVDSMSFKAEELTIHNVNICDDKVFFECRRKNTKSKNGQIKDSNTFPRNAYR